MGKHDSTSSNPHIPAVEEKVKGGDHRAAPGDPGHLNGTPLVGQPTLPPEKSSK